MLGLIKSTRICLKFSFSPQVRSSCRGFSGLVSLDLAATKTGASGARAGGAGDRTGAVGAGAGGVGGRSGDGDGTGDRVGAGADGGSAGDDTGDGSGAEHILRVTEESEDD